MSRAGRLVSLDSRQSPHLIHRKRARSMRNASCPATHTLSQIFRLKNPREGTRTTLTLLLAGRSYLMAEVMNHKNQR
jgi:hypothetical protein